MQIAVIGAGIIGSAVARELTRRGAAVTVFDQAGPGRGTSGTTFAWVNSNGKQPASYHRLNAAGCDEHRRLAEDVEGVADWYVRGGNIVWADDEGRRRLDDRMSLLESAGYPCRWIDAGEARALEPDLLLPHDAGRVAYFPDEAHVLPALLLARLLGEARDGGAVLRCPVRVASVEPAGAGGDVMLGSGERERFDRVVSCVGRWTEQLGAASGIQVPLVDPAEAGGAAVGFLAYTAPVPVRLSRVLTTPRVNVRPDGGGRLVLQGLDLDASADPADVPDAESFVARELVRRLGEVLAVDDGAMVDAVRVGQRAFPADGLTVAGFDERSDGRVYVVATHSGVTLGPLLGRLVASEVLGDGDSDLLADFRPGRFAEAEPADGVRAARLPGEQ